MIRFKSEELEDFIPPSLDAPKSNDQPYFPKRREREWTRKRHNKIALMRLIHEDKNDDDIRIMLKEKDEKEAMKKLKQPFKLQKLIRRDIHTKRSTIDMMGMVAPVNTGNHRGLQKASFRKYNSHTSPIVEHGLFSEPHKEELDWILEKHDNIYKPNCFDTLPPYATALARSTYDEPSPSTRLGRKRPLPVVPLPKIRKKQPPSSMASNNLASSSKQPLSSRYFEDAVSSSMASNNTTSSSKQPLSSRYFEDAVSSSMASNNTTSSSKQPLSSPYFEDDESDDMDEFDVFEL